ncbi:MAG TPA: peptidoglycan recognition protein [Kofleriaceae bacterium]|nr:peptidoglycan recognition protein [Kofleriaceae bacterium]
MFALVLLCACGDTPTDDEIADDSADRLTLEDDEIASFLGADRVSDPIASTAGFRRVGLLWDATEDNALEVRTSLDGVIWTEWKAPQVVSQEQIARAGHVDAVVGIAATGSTATDPLATYYQLRVPEGRVLPTFIVVEPMPDIPAIFDPDEAVAEDPEDTQILEASTPIGSVTIHSRREWGARLPRCATSRMTPNRATIHHTVTPTRDSMTVPQRLRQIQSFHMFSRGWCDIGYNYLVSRDGRVWRGRGARTVGAHVLNSNTGNVGISFIGTYTATAPTADQMCNAARLLRRLHEDFGGISLTRDDVKGHRQYGGTSCPGDALYNRIDDIVRKARSGCATN